jgi:hypothetical protein
LTTPLVPKLFLKGVAKPFLKGVAKWPRDVLGASVQAHKLFLVGVTQWWRTVFRIQAPAELAKVAINDWVGCDASEGITPSNNCGPKVKLAREDLETYAFGRECIARKGPLRCAEGHLR